MDIFLGSIFSVLLLLICIGFVVLARRSKQPGRGCMFAVGIALLVVLLPIIGLVYLLSTCPDCALP
jgi:Kef-type K+ transport system membrane component KefB